MVTWNAQFAPPSGGGGGGGSLSDVVMADANSVMFIIRDNGSTLSYVKLSDGSAYTPVQPFTPIDILAMGTDASGVSGMAGAAGVRGWLSGIYAGMNDLATSGNITAQNVNATGVGTANSFVGFSNMSGRGTVAFQVTGTYTGALTPQVSNDGVNWVSLGNSGLENIGTGAYSTTVASGASGMYSADVSGIAFFRLVALAAVTGTAVITMRASEGTQMVSLDNPIPAGANSIGTVVLGTGAAVIGALTANQSVNFNQIAGTAPSNLLGSGGASRVLGVQIAGATLNTDKTSAAVTTTGSTGAIADDFGQSIAALVNVTAVSGTSPTLDLVLQESFDNGTTWQDVYHVPRITAVSTFTVPNLALGGRRQWKYTVGGTSPSFTFSISAMRGQNAEIIRAFFDRALATTQAVNANAYSGVATANSTTGVYNIEGCSSVTMAVSSAAATTPCSVQMQFSVDGSTWYDATAAVTASVANKTVAVPSIAGVQAKFVRGNVTVAGSGQTLNYISFFGKG